MARGTVAPILKETKVELTLHRLSFLPGQSITIRRTLLLAFRGERILCKGQVGSFVIKELLIGKENQFSDGGPPVPAALFANAGTFPLDPCPKGGILLATFTCTEEPAPWWKFWIERNRTFALRASIIGTVTYSKDEELALFREEEKKVSGRL
jgi:hypothetical protein